MSLITSITNLFGKHLKFTSSKRSGRFNHLKRESFLNLDINSQLLWVYNKKKSVFLPNSDYYLNDFKQKSRANLEGLEARINVARVHNRKKRIAEVKDFRISIPVKYYMEGIIRSGLGYNNIEVNFEAFTTIQGYSKSKKIRIHSEYTLHLILGIQELDFPVYEIREIDAPFFKNLFDKILQKN